ncbi:MAG: hypothetical protein U0641_12170 [Anaerolineae bacterium]
MRRIAALVMLGLVLALLQTSVGFASEPASGPELLNVTRETKTETVNWTMKPGFKGCWAIQRQIDGVGQRQQETVTVTSPNGDKTVTIYDVVTGTAQDSKGSYTFDYVNFSSETTPAGGTVHQITMLDSFVLKNNSGVKLNVNFNWRWTYKDPAAYWPPVDNLQKFSTHGDPLTCDPI